MSPLLLAHSTSPFPAQSCQPSPAMAGTCRPSLTFGVWIGNGSLALHLLFATFAVFFCTLEILAGNTHVQIQLWVLLWWEGFMIVAAPQTLPVCFAQCIVLPACWWCWWQMFLAPIGWPILLVESRWIPPYYCSFGSWLLTVMHSADQLRLLAQWLPSPLVILLQFIHNISRWMKLFLCTIKLSVFLGQWLECVEKIVLLAYVNHIVQPRLEVHFIPLCFSQILR